MMIILYVYLGSVALTVAVDKFYNKAYEKELAIKGYRYKKIPRNIYKDIKNNIIEFLLMCIPVVNLACAIAMFNNLERDIEIEFNSNLEDGVIEKIPNEEVTKLIEAVEVDNNLVEDAKVVVYKVEDKEKKEMTTEEKLEFLREEYKRLTGEEVLEDTKGKQRGIGKRR